MWIVIPIIALAIIGIFAVKMLSGKSVDGAYIAKSVIVDGKEYTMDYFEEAAGTISYEKDGTKLIFEKIADI